MDSVSTINPRHGQLQSTLMRKDEQLLRVYNILSGLSELSRLTLLSNLNFIGKFTRVWELRGLSGFIELRQFMPMMLRHLNLKLPWKFHAPDMLGYLMLFDDLAELILLKFTLAFIRKLDKLILQAEKNDIMCDVLVGTLKISISLVLRELMSLFPRLREPGSVRSISEFSLKRYFFPSITPALSSFLSSLDDLDDEARYLKNLIPLSPDSESALDLEFAYNVFVWVVVLSIVYQYLIGYIDRGGTKTYNSGSLEFRATYVSLLLFQGAYVWIKFRDVPSKRTVYTRSRRNRSGSWVHKYEPRFKPFREKDVVPGEAPNTECLPLGSYDTSQDAKVVCQIAGFYYERDAGILELDDGSQFSIPQMSEQERSLRGEKKRIWVSAKAKEVYKKFKEEEAVRRQSRSSTLRADFGEQVDAGGSRSTDQVAEDELAFFHSGPVQDDGLMMSSDPVNVDDMVDVNDFFLEGFDGIPTMQEISPQLQLDLWKKQREAEFNRRFAEQQEQHLQHLEEQKLEFNRQTAEQDQIRQHLEVRIAELLRKIDHLQSILIRVFEPLSSYFATSTEI